MLGREEDEIPNLDVVRDRLLVPSSVTSKGSKYPAEGIEPEMFQRFPLKNSHMRICIFENYCTKWKAK